MKKNIFKSILASLVFLLVISSVVSSQSQVEPWDSEVVYLKGDRVTWNTNLWEAKWWTKGDEPGTQGEWGVWKKISQEISLNVHRADWVAKVDSVSGFGNVELTVSGQVVGTDVVTIETYGDGIIGEVALTVDAAGKFNETVSIQFTHAPTTAPFIASTVIRAKMGDAVVSQVLESSELRYPVAGNALLSIGINGGMYGSWSYPITDVRIDGIVYSLPCTVSLPKGQHQLEAIVKWWVHWSWSDIMTIQIYPPVDPPNPRWINLQENTQIYIIMGK
jgi:hypothetical protein